jgi:hypothetical protein
MIMMLLQAPVQALALEVLVMTWTSAVAVAVVVMVVAMKRLCCTSAAQRPVALRGFSKKCE